MTPAEQLDLLAAARAFEAMVRGPHVMWDGLPYEAPRCATPGCEAASVALVVLKGARCSWFCVECAFALTRQDIVLPVAPC